jgi:hypothetical protein
VDPTPAVERHIALDLARRGLWVAPVVVAVAAAVRGTDGAAGAAVGLGIVLANFLAAAASMTWAARRSPKVVGGVALGGFVVRLAVILVAMLALRDVPAIDFPTFSVVLVAAHLGLLTWESRHVSMSLGAPGLRPRPPVAHGGA